ncbi:hypothetical protein FEF26_01770 [Nesterenkonia salmonea]|uniref:Glycerophosphoryl diester phosphodiesterase membrane domain-containing protein n=1 Tax=Nesterenkonia salmonea TaxID=1804987 RepID=A0A5R9BI11_9MICC|nr:hypothetical protein [Nesterenkonia salmonea]TLQ00317.1 hypothetical protein FEF26_01770 [Nesterenkonia salmonea]
MGTQVASQLARTPVRPGAVFPLRPLAQDEIFRGAFSVIRRNPRAALGLPFLAAVLNFLVSLVLLVAMPADNYLRMMTDPVAFDDQELLFAALGEGGMVMMIVASSFIGSLVMAMSLGLLAIPVVRSAYGLPTTLRQTVLLRVGRLGWLLLHLLVLLVVTGVLSVIVVVAGVLLTVATFGFGLLLVLPGFFLLLCWLTAGLMFGPLVVVVERRNAFSAIGRSFALNRGMWWRHIGAVALLYLMLLVVLGVTSLPAGIVAGLGGELAWQSEQGQNDLLVLLVLGFGQLYDMALNTLLVALVGTVIGVMYLNARFRREALDVMLKHVAPPTPQTDSESEYLDTLLPASPEHLSAGAPKAPGGAPR